MTMTHLEDSFKMWTKCWRNEEMVSFYR